MILYVADLRYKFHQGSWLNKNLTFKLQKRHLTFILLYIGCDGICTINNIFPVENNFTLTPVIFISIMWNFFKTFYSGHCLRKSKTICAFLSWFVRVFATQFKSLILKKFVIPTQFQIFKFSNSEILVKLQIWDITNQKLKTSNLIFIIIYFHKFIYYT